MGTVTMRRRKSPAGIKRDADTLIASGLSGWALDWQLEGLQADAGCLSVCGKANRSKYMAVCLYIADKRAALKSPKGAARA